MKSGRHDSIWEEGYMTMIGVAVVNGVEISYEIIGEGSPLVLIHAGIADSRM